MTERIDLFQVPTGERGVRVSSAIRRLVAAWIEVPDNPAQAYFIHMEGKTLEKHVFGLTNALIAAADGELTPKQVSHLARVHQRLHIPGAVFDYVVSGAETEQQQVAIRDEPLVVANAGVIGVLTAAGEGQPGGMLERLAPQLPTFREALTVQQPGI